jgi:hypothetical protein
VETFLKIAFDAAGGGMAAQAQLSLVCKCGLGTRLLLHSGASPCCQHSACSLPITSLLLTPSIAVNALSSLSIPASLPTGKTTVT